MKNRVNSINLSLAVSTFLIGILASLFILYMPSLAAPNGIYVVNSTADTDDGTCSAANCTLREAINSANTAAGPDTITFSLPPSSTITLAGTQLPIISDTLTIDGSTSVNITVSGNWVSRIFEISSATSVTYTAITITRGGLGCPGCPFGDGAGILNEGGNLYISNTTFTSNRVSFGLGAAVASFGKLEIRDSFFLGNYADEGAPGGVYCNCQLTIINSYFGGNHGGGVKVGSGGTGTIINSSFYGNQAEDRYGQFAAGGGISNIGTLTVSGSIFTGNSATGNGGGISNGSNGILNVANSYFNYNKAFTFYGGTGGAISNKGIAVITGSNINSNIASSNFGGDNFVHDVGGGIYNGGKLTLNNSTVSGNIISHTANLNNYIVEMYGGGIYNADTMTVTNSTISSNIISGTTTVPSTTVTASGAGLYNDGTIIINNSTVNANSVLIDVTNFVTFVGVDNNGSLFLSNSIVANSVGGADCGAGANTGNINNLIEDGTCSPDFSGDPLLGPLQDNGGQSSTHVPMAGSLAIDNGDPLTCDAYDQRGAPRPIDGDDNGTAVCDIGSVEVGATFTFLPVVRNASLPFSN